MKGRESFNILILSDPDSWLNSYIVSLKSRWEKLGHSVLWEHAVQAEALADFCFCLGFSQLIPKELRQRFKHTLVVHESDLPAGRGWSPLTWQILDGQNRIPVTLIEAAEQVDSGVIYGQRWLEFEGHELIGELRAAQANATCDLCSWFVENFPESISSAIKQKGDPTYFPRRGPEDSELDITRTIEEQFNILRVVDNERYPAFFDWKGQRFYIKILKGRA